MDNMACDISLLFLIFSTCLLLKSFIGVLTISYCLWILYIEVYRESFISLYLCLLNKLTFGNIKSFSLLAEANKNKYFTSLINPQFPMS